jgi:hypothetical protein
MSEKNGQKPAVYTYVHEDRLEYAIQLMRELEEASTALINSEDDQNKVDCWYACRERVVAYLEGYAASDREIPY